MKRESIPTIHFQGRSVSFREGSAMHPYIASVKHLTPGMLSTARAHPPAACAWGRSSQESEESWWTDAPNNHFIINWKIMTMFIAMTCHKSFSCYFCCLTYCNLLCWFILSCICFQILRTFRGPPCMPSWRWCPANRPNLRRSGLGSA